MEICVFEKEKSPLSSPIGGIVMCNKLPYCNPRIDTCLISIINDLNKSKELRTLASCCGHGQYNPTIVVKDKVGNIFEFYSNKSLTYRKRNRYYKKDENGFYFIPELIKKNEEYKKLKEYEEK